MLAAKGREQSHIRSMTQLPTKEAKDLFRDVWGTYLFETGQSTRRILAETMLNLRNSVSDKPSDDWGRFVMTLPGYLEMARRVSTR